MLKRCTSKTKRKDNAVSYIVHFDSTCGQAKRFVSVPPLVGAFQLVSELHHNLFFSRFGSSVTKSSIVQRM